MSPSNHEDEGSGQIIADDSVITLHCISKTLPDVMPGRVRGKSSDAAPGWSQGGEGAYQAARRPTWAPWLR